MPSLQSVVSPTIVRFRKLKSVASAALRSFDAHRAAFSVDAPADSVASDLRPVRSPPAASNGVPGLQFLTAVREAGIPGLINVAISIVFLYAVTQFWLWVYSTRACYVSLLVQAALMVRIWITTAKHSVPRAQPPRPAPLKSSGVLPVFKRVPMPRVNPMFNRTWVISTAHRLWLCLAGVTILPVRVVGALSSVVTAFVVAVVGTVGLGKDSLERPIVGFRRVFLSLLGLCARSTLWWMGYLYVPVYGRVASPSEAPVIVGNHVTLVDPFFMLYLCMPSPVAAAEYYKFPLISTIATALQTMLVNRKDTESKRSSAAAILQRAQSGLWPQVLVYPEGTTTNQLGLLTFRAGAFAPGLPVQALASKFPITTTDPAWLCGLSQSFNVMKQMCEPFSLFEVHVLPVHVPTEAEKADPQLFANNVRSELAAFLGCEPTNYGYEDVRLIEESIKQGFAADALIERVVLSDVCGALKAHLHAAAVAQQVARFKEINTSLSGLVSSEEFLRFMSRGDLVKCAPLLPVWRHLFRLLDDQGSGALDFRSYLVGLGMLDFQRETLCETLFRTLDLSESDCVSNRALSDLLVFSALVDKVAADSAVPELTLESAKLQELSGERPVMSLSEFAQWAKAQPLCFQALSRTVLRVL